MKVRDLDLSKLIKWIFVGLAILSISYCNYHERRLDDKRQKIYDEEYRGVARSEFTQTEAYLSLENALTPGDIFPNWNKEGISAKELYASGNLFRHYDNEGSVIGFSNFTVTDLGITTGRINARNLNDMVYDVRAMADFKRNGEPSLQSIILLDDFYISSRANFYFDGNAFCTYRPHDLKTVLYQQFKEADISLTAMIKSSNKKPDPVAQARAENRSIIRSVVIHMLFKYPTVCFVYVPTGDGYISRMYLPDGRRISETPEYFEPLEETQENRQSITEVLRKHIGL